MLTTCMIGCRSTPAISALVTMAAYLHRRRGRARLSASGRRALRNKMKSENEMKNKWKRSHIISYLHGIIYHAGWALICSRIRAMCRAATNRSLHRQKGLQLRRGETPPYHISPIRASFQVGAGRSGSGESFDSEKITKCNPIICYCLF